MWALTFPNMWGNFEYISLHYLTLLPHPYLLLYHPLATGPQMYRYGHLSWVFLDWETLTNLRVLKVETFQVTKQKAERFEMIPSVEASGWLEEFKINHFSHNIYNIYRDQKAVKLCGVLERERGKGEERGERGGDWNREIWEWDKERPRERGAIPGATKVFCCDWERKGREIKEVMKLGKVGFGAEEASWRALVSRNSHPFRCDLVACVKVVWFFLFRFGCCPLSPATYREWRRTKDLVEEEMGNDTSFAHSIFQKKKMATGTDGPVCAARTTRHLFVQCPHMGNFPVNSPII